MPTRQRRSANDRGYNHHHRKTRDTYRPLIASGWATCTEPICLMPTRRMHPDQPWDLAHNRTTGGYHGPAHVRCNRAEAARYKNTRGLTPGSRALPHW